MIDLILFLVLNLAGIILILFLIKDTFTAYKGIKSTSKLIRKTVKITAIFFLLIGLPILIVKEYSKEPILNSTQEKIEFYTKYQHYLHLNDIYYEMLENDDFNLELQYKYVNSINLYIQESRNGRNLKRIRNSYRSDRTIDYYTSFTASSDSLKRDIGYSFLGLHYTNLKDIRKAGEFFIKVSDTSLTMYKFAYGNYLTQTHWSFNYGKAEKLLLNCINDSTNLTESYDQLMRLYYFNGKNEKFEALVHNPKSLKYLGSFPKRIVYMRDLDTSNYLKTIFKREVKALSIWGGIASFLILLAWIFYLRKVDIYEPEKWSHTIITLLLSMCTIYFIFPIHDIIWDIFHYFPGSNATEDFIYDFLTIGMVEEFVKIIPVLLILRFTKAINEPFDYIYYCSISALGFAFIENIGYIQESSLYNINARALMASVGHMVFSSTIGYGLMLAKYKQYKYAIFPFLIFFGIASLMHGFYDLWLLHDWALEYHWITTIFLILSIHVWHIYANNTLNITTFYNSQTKVRNDKLKYHLIISLIGIMMFSYVSYAFTQGPSSAKEMLIRQLFIYGYFILYLAFSFSRFEIIRGYLAPLNIPLTLLIPRLNRTSNFTGLSTKISASNKFRLLQEYSSLKNMLPTNSTLERRIVLDDNLESYIAKLDKPISIEGYLTDVVIIMPRSKKKKLNDSGNILIHLFLIKTNECLNKPVLSKDDFQFVGWAVSTKVD